MALELDYLFHPRSIAVAGASPDPRSAGHRYVAVLLEHEFPGPIYPVHPTASSILGLPAYRSVLEAPGPVDYVISCIPAPGLPELVDQCARHGVRVLQSFTARFSETGRPEAAALEQEVLRRARAGGVRVVGPNCMGVYCPSTGMAFKHGMPREPGTVGVLSQSGGNAQELVMDGAARGLRFSRVVSYGNALDLNEGDLLEYLAEDPDTQVVGAYIEGVRDGRRLFRALGSAAARKPVVVLKGGRTGAGSRAVASHTASLAGPLRLWEALAAQTGAVLAASMSDLVDLLVAFRFCRPGTGTRAAVVGGGGGRSVASADECEEAGLELPPLPPEVRDRLRALDPSVADWVGNPADASIMGDGGVGLLRVLQEMASSPQYDMVIANVGEHFPLEHPSGAEQVLRSVDAFVRVAHQAGKPVAVVMGEAPSLHAWQREALLESRERVIGGSVALFPTVARAAAALRRVALYYRRRDEATPLSGL